jgi:Tol biopolymer transport system component
VALSPDGTRAAFNRGFDATDPNTSLWLLDFSKGTTTRLTFGSPHTEAPIWSPDGKRIIFASSPNGSFDLYEKLASGAEDEQLLLKSSENKFPSSVSRDGRFLLYFVIDSKTSKFGLWVLPLEGDKKPFPFLHTGFNEVDGHFSPDGHWVAYVSDESGRYEVYVRRFSGDAAVSPSGEGAKWQVSYEGGWEPRWRADGKELYYTTLDGKVMVVGVNTNTVFEAAPVKLLFQAPLEASRTTGDHTADGKRFLFLTSPEQAAQTPFTVVLNWQAALKK